MALKLTLVMCVAFSAAAGRADPSPPPQTDPPSRARVGDPTAQSTAKGEDPTETETPPEGLWPSRKLLELVLRRRVEEAGEEYGLDPGQKERVREMLVDRWVEFLEDNRGTFQPIANEFIEMRMGLEPPDSQRVRSWSDRALPAFQRVRDELRATQDEFRDVLTPGQRMKFEFDALKAAAGLQLAENKLRQWTQGEFEPDDVWEPLPSMRTERRRNRDRRDDSADAAGTATAPAADEAGKTPVDQIASELTAWEKFVADFVRDYNLDEGQRTSAVSCLKELSERASTHRDRHRDEISAMEARIAESKGTAEELAEIKQKLVELYGPVDEMFKELKTRLEAIPTAEQRARFQESAETKATSPQKQVDPPAPPPEQPKRPPPE